MGTFRNFPKVVSIGQLGLHWTFPWKITGREYSLCSAELKIRTTDLSCNLARKLCQIGPNYTDAYPQSALGVEAVWSRQEPFGAFHVQFCALQL